MWLISTVYIQSFCDARSCFKPNWVCRQSAISWGLLRDVCACVCVCLCGSMSGYVGVCVCGGGLWVCVWEYVCLCVRHGCCHVFDTNTWKWSGKHTQRCTIYGYTGTTAPHCTARPFGHSHPKLSPFNRGQSAPIKYWMCYSPLKFLWLLRTEFFADMLMHACNSFCYHQMKYTWILHAASCCLSQQ